MSAEKNSKRQKSSRTRFEKLIFRVERVGNLLPHPFFLFIILITLIFFLSYLLNQAGVSVTHFGFTPSIGQSEPSTVSVVNLLQKGMLQTIMGNFVKTFAYFIPVGFVIIMILGVGLAEQSGLFSAVIRLLIFKTPKYFITFARPPFVCAAVRRAQYFCDERSDPVDDHRTDIYPPVFPFGCQPGDHAVCLQNRRLDHKHHFSHFRIFTDAPGLLEKYRNKDQYIGIGSAISLMLPYSLFLFIFWALYFALWLILKLDPGPGASIFL